MTIPTQRSSHTEWNTVRLPQPSEVCYVGREASVQFALHPFNFRVSRIRPIDEHSIWIWADGYELNAAGEAIARRTIFVMRTGLRPPRVIPQQRRRRPETVNGQ
jgi:hypothetical protein